MGKTKKADKRFAMAPEHKGKVRTTGYFIPPAGGYKSKAEEKMEGGANDCFGNALRCLEDFDPKDPGSYVSIATDPKFIPKLSLVKIEGFEGVHFVACDVGGGIKGAHIDICCRAKALTFKVTGTKDLDIIGKALLV